MSHQNSKNWGDATSNMDIQVQTETCQKFLSQLSEEQRKLLLAPFIKPAVPNPIPTHVQHESRSQAKTPASRSRNEDQSGSRKRRQTTHADVDPSIVQDESFPPLGSQQTHQSYNLEYKTIPIFLQNKLPDDIKKNPKRLSEVLMELKPEAKIKNIFVCHPSGDLKLTALTPHDENILRQEWPQDKYGSLRPRLPKEKTANQEVVITNIPTCVSNAEIQEKLRESQIEPKDIFRFNRKGSNDPSLNVKISLGSAKDKERLMKNGFFIYSQHFRVVEGKAAPNVIQCFKCQKYGHPFFQCKATNSTCLRCAGNHRLSECTAAKESAKCSNCNGNHAASYKGCQMYKDEVKKAKEEEEKKSQEKRQSSLAKIVAPSQRPATQPDTLSLLSCLAESLSELVSHFKEAIGKGEEPNELAPFNIVSKAAHRHLNLEVSVHYLYMKVLNLTPTKTGPEQAMDVQSASLQPMPCQNPVNSV